MEETLNETWDIYEKKVHGIVENKLGVTNDIEFNRCHRTVYHMVVLFFLMLQGTKIKFVG